MKKPTKKPTEETLNSLRKAEDFFVFYGAIPAEKWCQGAYANGGRCCALGHLGFRADGLKELSSPAAEKAADRLKKIIKKPTDQSSVPDLNDGVTKEEFGKTPRERILNALKAAQQKKRK